MTPGSGTGAVATAKSEYRFWVTLLGVLLSIPALVSVTQRIFKVGLVPLIHDIVVYYRKLYYPIFQLVGSYFLTLFPYIDLHRFLYWLFISRETYQDLTALALISATALLRAVVLERLRAFEKERVPRAKQSLSEEIHRLKTALKGMKEGRERTRYEKQQRKREKELARLEQGRRGWALLRGRGTGLEPLVESYILLTFLAIVCGYTLLGLLLPFLTMVVIRFEDEAIRRINRQYLVSLVLAFCAAGVVYVTNELMK
jgi:hypothetical protein